MESALTMEVKMGLFSIKNRSDSSHYPPFSNQQQREKKQEELNEKNIVGPSSEVSISDSLRIKIKQERLLRKKAEEGFSLLQLAQEGLKNIKEIIVNEKNFEEVKKKIEEICESTTYAGKKILDHKEGHQEFLKYFPDFQIDAPFECRFVPNLSPSCLKLENGNKEALLFIEKQENLINEKKDLILKELVNETFPSDISSLLDKTTDNLLRNKDLGIKIQSDFFTQDLLKII
jgi:hypothetical protein